MTFDRCKYVFLGTPLRDFADCRQHGCVTGECIREGSQYVCKQGMFYLILLFFYIENV